LKAGEGSVSPIRFPEPVEGLPFLLSEGQGFDELSPNGKGGGA
jgi:hypothetical protein